MIFFPKNAFQKIVSNTFERMLPTLQYIVWNPITRYARSSGWTEQEKCYHNFFRGGNIMYHSIAQSMHPLAYIERARADNFFRRVETILPGIEVPDWAHQEKRAVDIDFEGALNPFRALNIIDQESTPKPHYGHPYPSSINHIGNYRQLLGYYAQRLFFNENLRGNMLTGKYSDSKKKSVNSWYATADNKYLLDLQNMSQEELGVLKSQAEQWVKNIDQFFPEYRNLTYPEPTHIVYEPYLKRTVDDICNHIFISKWIDAMERKLFTAEDYQKIYEFYLHQQDHVFWTLNQEDGQYHPTTLYLKFIKIFSLPNVFELNKYTARVVEQQYKDSLTNNYGINLNTVEQFRKQHQKIISELNRIAKEMNISHADIKRLRLFITEEVYNPLFRKKLIKKPDDARDSMILELFQKHGIDILDDFEKIHNITKEELFFMNKEIQENFMIRMRNIVKSFPFKQLQTIARY